jgi:tripartite ATP-independent transporter DctM subunit
MTLAWLVGGVMVLLLVRVPVAFALLLPSVVYVAQADGITLGVVLQRLLSGLNSFPLLAVPLFILTGFLANAAGIADRLFAFLLGIFGRVRGSLGYVNVTSSVVFSWMSGAAIADAAGLGSVLVPAMRKRGYDEGFALGLTGASAMIGPIMPPSIPAIIYAVTAGVSVGALFFAGVVPALVLAGVLCVHVFVHARRRGFKATIEPWMGWAGLGGAALRALPVLFTPVIILGGILGGIFTPTEAAAAAVMYVLLLSAGYRSLTWQALYGVALRTASTTGSILLIVSSATLFGWVIAREQGPEMVAAAMLQMTHDPVVFLLLVNLGLLLIGMLLEPVAALLITVPVLLPVAAQFEVDPLHLGIVMILNLVIGLLTPPVGLVLYVLSSVTNTPFPVVARGALPFLLPLLVTLGLVTFWPGLSLALPRWLGLG